MKTVKQVFCTVLLVISIAVTALGCRSVPVTIDPALLEDNLIEETGGPVVAPTNIQHNNNADKSGNVDFGKEKYIWDNWQ